MCATPSHARKPRIWQALRPRNIHRAIHYMFVFCYEDLLANEVLRHQKAKAEAKAGLEASESIDHNKEPLDAAGWDGLHQARRW